MQASDLSVRVLELCNNISLEYGLNQASVEFSALLANRLKKWHGYLSFEQIEMAFEYNSHGLLNDYLPRVGNNVDNKVKFTIPDMNKIIKAFVRLKELDKHKIEQEQEWAIEKKDLINRAWCDQLENIFAIYRQKRERTPITLPTYTAEVLAKIGLLNKKDIDYTENAIVLRLKHIKEVKRTHNENLIYAAFDRLINNGNSIDAPLKPFRERYVVNSEISLPF